MKLLVMELLRLGQVTIRLEMGGLKWPHFDRDSGQKRIFVQINEICGQLLGHTCPAHLHGPQFFLLRWHFISCAKLRQVVAFKPGCNSKMLFKNCKNMSDRFMFSAVANGRGTTYIPGNGYQTKVNALGYNILKFPARRSIFDSRAGKNVMQKNCKFRNFKIVGHAVP